MGECRETLEDIRDAFEASVSGQCSLEALKSLKNELLTELGLKLPPEGEEVFGFSNGIFHDDFCLCYAVDPSSEEERFRESSPNNEILAVNRQYHRNERFPSEYLILGFGDFGLIVSDQKEKCFHLVDERTFELIDSYESLDELLNDMLDMIEGVEDSDEETGDDEE